MRVLIVTPPTKDQPVARDMMGGLGFDGGDAVVLPPLDLAYIAATLLSKGYEAKIVDSNIENYGAEDIFHITREYAPDVIMAPVSLPTLYKDCSFLESLRRAFSAKIIAKTGISYPPILKEILEKTSADFCIYGECDTNIDQILSGKEKSGTAWLGDDGLEIEDNQLIDNLDSLPLPARSLLPNEKYHYVLLGDKTTTMQTSRGCPFACNYYCPYPLVQGRKWRARSPEHVCEEIEDIKVNYNINKILFRDAVFTLDKERTKQICDLIIKNRFGFEWWCETRINCLDKQLIRKMKQAGCQGMNVGLETGDPEILESQAKPGVTLSQLKDITSFSKNVGMKLHFLLMVGLPGETKASLYQTYKLVQKLTPQSIGITFVTPYPGTPLYFEAKKKGWLITEDWSKFGGHHPVMHTDNLSTEDLLEAQRMIYQGFHLSRSSSLKKLAGTRLKNNRFRRWAFC